MKLNKARINFVIDVAIGIAFLVEVASGLVLWLVLPRGGYRGGRNQLYGQTLILSREGWLTLHDWGAVVMVLGILVHLVMHRRWIYHTLRSLWRGAFDSLPAQTRVSEGRPAQ